MNQDSDINLLKFSVMIASLKTEDVLKIGKELVKLGFDDITDGGFWIWEVGTNIEFYSPKFRSVLGYEGEHDFPSLAQSWQDSIHLADLKLAIRSFNKALETGGEYPYDQFVTYSKKNGEKISFTCSGKLLKLKGEFKYLIGTHKIEETTKLD